MRHQKIRTLIGVVVATAFVAGLAGVGHAGQPRTEEGLVLISHARALVGGVTLGDAPGYPVTISRPGSYLLSSNLVVPNEDTTAILITANGVTLDLNGFAILGPGVAGAGLGVSGSDLTTVVNGAVAGMGSAGVVVGMNGRVERVLAVNNGSSGIMTGTGSIVSGNIARDNGLYGINAAPGSMVSGNTAVGNTGGGISAGAGNMVSGNTARGNFNFGLYLDDASVGYANNVITGVNTVSGGTDLGQNLCNSGSCP